MYNLFRYCLGTFYESVHFQLLTGIKLGYQREPFWPIFLAITLVLSGAAFLSVNLKKMKERYRDLKFLQKINININIKVTKYFILKAQFYIQLVFKVPLCITFTISDLFFTPNFFPIFFYTYFFTLL